MDKVADIKESGLSVQRIQYLAILPQQISIIAQFCIHVESVKQVYLNHYFLSLYCARSSSSIGFVSYFPTHAT